MGKRATPQVRHFSKQHGGAGNGQTLLSTQVDQLIQAMASFSLQTGLTWDQAIDQRPQDVQTVLAANGWQ